MATKLNTFTRVKDTFWNTTYYIFGDWDLQVGISEYTGEVWQKVVDVEGIRIVQDKKNTITWRPLKGKWIRVWHVDDTTRKDENGISYCVGTADTLAEAKELGLKYYNAYGLNNDL
jgi:hypothetical protein